MIFTGRLGRRSGRWRVVRTWLRCRRHFPRSSYRSTCSRSRNFGLTSSAKCSGAGSLGPRARGTVGSEIWVISHLNDGDLVYYSENSRRAGKNISVVLAILTAARRLTAWRRPDLGTSSTPLGATRLDVGGPASERLAGPTTADQVITEQHSPRNS